ncbi:hypothetical protein [Entomospira culicis]|uniref:Uncharacterized protein n=1 Tax=Entomospira culicis TaxID=2719989 RepID=A0A968KW75_9SPIO|nr:hypothetical protein [Entomospira culicis]NIZ18672.1 hypothetical protein [Entomospira culicis]NIZ68887.1 hypothetical protein [Entomospira culicis]WDI37480.1 hypothetical protein PVA46_01445 [Entomospira culicis]WDI39108.1 hypothetical protein PVA47_01450 [Entomospira culicis]
MRNISWILFLGFFMTSNLWASGYLLPKWLTDLAELPRMEFGLSRAQITQRLVDAGWQEVTPSDTLNAKEFYWGIDAETKISAIIFANGRLLLRSRSISLVLMSINQDIERLAADEFNHENCWYGDNGNNGCNWRHKELRIALKTFYDAQKRRQGIPYTTITISME